MSKVLSETEIVQQLPDWRAKKGKIEKEFEFKDFRGSINFVNKIAALAEAANHHPEIEIDYNKVEIELSTHSAGGVTQKDIALAKEIEGTYEN